MFDLSHRIFASPVLRHIRPFALVLVMPGAVGHEGDLGGKIAVPGDIKIVEILQVIRADGFLRTLGGEVTIIAGYQLRTYFCLQYRREHRLRRIIELVRPDDPPDQMLYQCLGYACVYVVMGHVVAHTVGAPAQCELAEVPCADDKRTPHVGNAEDAGEFLTSSGAAADRMLKALCNRMERVRVLHGDWTRCLNHTYGGDGPGTAVFLDPPYSGYEEVYGGAEPVSVAVGRWARENETIRICLCGHAGEYDLPGWDVAEWERERTTYGSEKTKADERIWFSPACQKPHRYETADLFGGVE